MKKNPPPKKKDETEYRKTGGGLWKQQYNCHI